MSELGQMAFDRIEQGIENEKRILISKNIPIDRLEQICQAERENRLVILPCKVGDTVDRLFSHNEIIALWHDKESDKDYSYLLWRGMAWDMPNEYKNAPLLKIFGAIPENISEADTINLLIDFTREAAEQAKEGEK